LFLAICIIIQYSCEKTKEPVNKDIVINELMPVNSSVAADQDNEYDDWIELYNRTETEINLSGYFLTDNRKNITKWQFPQGTSIQGKGFLIIWADKDSTQIGLHTNFKLSSLGEELLLSKPDLTLIDETVYPGQTLELSYSRDPNGTGPFKWTNPTFNTSN